MTNFVPCRVCGATPDQAPEGVDIHGVPRWPGPHCFKCGHLDGDALPTDQAAQYAMFQRWREEKMAEDMAHPTMNPPENPQQVTQELRQAFTPPQSS